MSDLEDRSGPGDVPSGKRERDARDWRSAGERDAEGDSVGQGSRKPGVRRASPGASAGTAKSADNPKRGPSGGAPESAGARKRGAAGREAPGAAAEKGAGKRRRGTKDPEQMRRALKQAAMKAFAEEGFDGARADRIARDANANKAMINYHFGGKKGLYDAVLQEALLPARDAVRDLLSRDLPAEVQLRRFVRTISERMEAHPALAPMIVREAMSGGRHLEESFAPIVVEMFRGLATIIERGVAAGVFRPVDPFRTHLAVMGPIAFFHATGPFRERLVEQGMIPAEPVAARDFAQHVADLVLNGLKGQGGVGPQVEGREGGER